MLEESSLHEDQAATPVDENTGLLPKQGNGDVPAAGDGQDSEKYNARDAIPWGRDFLHELKVVFVGSVPVVLAYALQNSLQTLSVVIVGRTSPDDLATAAFAYMFAMSTAWLIALGGTTALDTLASSTFTGSKNRHDLGILLQRAFLVLGAMYVPIAVLWLCSETFFLALGQYPKISRDSARFLTCLIPGGLGYICFEAMKKYLQAQGKS